MSTSPHTPGPWHNYIAPHGTRHILPCPWPTLGTVQICTFNGSAHRPAGETEANARLIAAAPELLAALEALKEWGCTYTGPRDANSPHALLIAAHHAIAKARGEYIPTAEDLARRADEECDRLNGMTTSNPGREDFCRGT